MPDGTPPCSQTIDSSCGVLVTETKLRRPHRNGCVWRQLRNSVNAREYA